MLVSPELACGAKACSLSVIAFYDCDVAQLTSLDLIDDESHVVLLRDVAKTLEESGRGVVIATLALNGLNDERSDRAVPT